MNLLIPAAAGFFSLDTTSVFPTTGLPRGDSPRRPVSLCAQLVWCKLYDMRNVNQKDQLTT